jgi:phage tail protein X
MPKRILPVLFLIALVFTPQKIWAFTHIVTKGDTLAALAERYYGRIQHEKILVAANSLDAQGGIAIVPGMRLEIPALSHRRVQRGETWAGLAEELLGSRRRADVLAAANGTSPWLPPEDAAHIVVPYNLPVIVAGSDTIVSIAYKYMGNVNKAWVLDYYNGFKGRALQRGDVVLVPLTDLTLTEGGRKSAAEATRSTSSESFGETRHVQVKVNSELPALIADVRAGRYVEAVRRGNGFLASGSLTTPQLARIHRQLLEAYVALEVAGLASAACVEWRKNDPAAKLDPVQLSPKIIQACERATR